MRVCVLMTACVTPPPQSIWGFAHTPDHTLRTPPHEARMRVAVAVWWLGGSCRIWSPCTNIMYPCLAHHYLVIIIIIIHYYTIGNILETNRKILWMPPPQKKVGPIRSYHPL